MHRSLHPLVLSLAIALGSAAPAWAAPTGAAMAPSDRALAALYWEGHDALQHADWNLALERFRELETRLRASEPASTDAALYWQAYALAQAGRSGEARAAVERLQRDFPDSRWKGDATALLRGAPARTAATPVDDDAELASAAVDALLQAPAERAVPILRKVLASDHPDRLKKRALFVLGQLDSEAALGALREVATSGSPTLQREAVQMLGISGSKASLDVLDALYAAQPDLRGRILHAWLVADAEDRVLAAARGEADAELRADAVQVLGAMGAEEALAALYADSREASVRSAIVRSFGVAGAAGRLEQIARSDADAGVRQDAMHSLGVAGAGDALVRLYRESEDAALRRAALDGLMVAGDSQGVLEVYRNARSAEDKRHALRTLTLIGDDAALELIEEALQ